MSHLRNKSRGKHPFIGAYVIVEYRTVRGGDGKYVEDWSRELFPVDQRRHQMHPRHPSGYSVATGKRTGCISPSCGFYKELCDYGQFKWRER